MRILPTIKSCAPITLVAKVKERRMTYYEELKEAYEDPSFVLIQYDNGVKIPAPLCLPFRDMLKYSRKVNLSTITSWIALQTADKNRSRKMVQEYIEQHERWRAYHVQG